MKKLLFVIIALFVAFQSYTQEKQLIPYQTITDSSQFYTIIDQIKDKTDALYVFDIDNTLLITNDNGFGSDWWYTQTKTNPELKLNISNDCLFNVLTPLFYSMFNTSCLFQTQSQILTTLGKGNSRTIALTSRGYSPTVGAATETELRQNRYSFLEKDSILLAKNVVMQNSVIYTKGQNKGEILLNYLKDHTYKSIYFFDDSKFKVEAIQEAFSGSGIDISIYWMKIAPKIPYTEEEIRYMQDKLRILINKLNQPDQSCQGF